MYVQGNLSVGTTRLLKAILPAACLWTSLRECEGFGFEETLKELKNLYPDEEGDEDDDMDGNILGKNVPQPIKDMVSSKASIEALGGMIWCVLLDFISLTV
jgi:DNA mismatch repair protein MSH6